MESKDEPLPESPAGLSIRVLGAVRVTAEGQTRSLPNSRKVRALLGFLLLSRGPIGRSRLCDLLWDVPNDPRSELRWCLSRIRKALGEVHQQRVVSEKAGVSFDSAGCFVDVHEVEGVAQLGITEVTSERLSNVCELFRGDLLDELTTDDSPEFGGWLAAQRQRYRTLHVKIVNELATRAALGSDEMFQRLESWLRLAPFDTEPHQLMLRALVQCGRVRDAEQHLASATRSFKREGADFRPLVETLGKLRDDRAHAPTLESSHVSLLTEHAPEPPTRSQRSASAFCS